MDFDAWYTTAVLIIVIASLISNRMGMDVAILGGLVMLMLGGVIDIGQATEGFASTSVLMLAGLFIIATGLERTGAISHFARRLLGRPTTVAAAQLRLMVPVSLLSGFMNNTPIVAVCLTIVRDWARRMQISPSHLYMPLSFAAILGGKLTLIGTASNIILMEDYVQWFDSDGAKWAGTLGFDAPSSFMQFFGVAAIGLPCLVAGLGFIVLASPFLLPIRKAVAADDLLDARNYQVGFVVKRGSAVIGQSIEQAGLRQLPGLFLSGVERGGVALPAVDPNLELAEGDRLGFVGVLESVIDLRGIRGLEPDDDQVQKLEFSKVARTLVEAVVSANSPLVGKSVRQARFRTRYRAAILAVHRQGAQIAAKIGDIVLKPGDTLLLETSNDFRSTWKHSDEFFLVSNVPESVPLRHDLAPVALGVLAILVALLAFSPVDRVAAVWGCALVMILTRCATGTEARNGIHWQVLLVIAGSIGIGNALVTTGLAQTAGEQIVALGGGWGLPAMLVIIFLAGAIASQFITNYAAAALLFPIGMTIAAAMQIDPSPILFVLMLGVGGSFISPIGYQTNLMVYGPGGYRFLDYARLGVPLTILLAVLCAFIAPLVYGS
ncbi:MAG: SLC13 family permease [Phycisphaerales bacterium]|nr:SLC13 family permease [Phycisphaerales bacterium]